MAQPTNDLSGTLAEARSAVPTQTHSAQRSTARRSTVMMPTDPTADLVSRATHGRRTGRLRLSSYVLGALLAAAPAALAQGDVVVQTDGSRVRDLQITATGSKEITAETENGPRNFPIRSFREIVWGSMPEAFDLGEAAERAGDFSLAAIKFEEALGAIDREVVRPDVQFLALRSRVRSLQGDANAAGSVADDINSWLGSNPDHYRTPDAMFWRGQALRAAGEAAAAASLFDQLEKDALSNGWQPIWSARAKLEQGLAETAAGNHAQSRATLRAALSAAESVNDPSFAQEIASLQTNATSAIGESMIEEGDPDKALGFFRDGSSNESAALSAARKAGEGQALYVQAVTSLDVNDMRQAQIALAEAIVLDPEGGDVTAKAQFFTGKLLLLLGDERERSSSERARDYFRTVVDAYQGSRWASQARAELEG